MKQFVSIVYSSLKKKLYNTVTNQIPTDHLLDKHFVIFSCNKNIETEVRSPGLSQCNMLE